MWVIFEGLDKAGKTTLEWEFLKATNFKHIVIDRGPAGYVTFDYLFKRFDDENENQIAACISDMINSNNFLVVYCKAPVHVAMKRLEEHNETCPYDYELAQALYDRSIGVLYQDRKISVVTIDTMNSIEDCVKMIIEKLEEVQKREL